MSPALGIVGVLGFVMLCGGSALDEPLSEKSRLGVGLGISAFTVVLALVVGFLA